MKNDALQDAVNCGPPTDDTWRSHRVDQAPTRFVEGEMVELKQPSEGVPTIPGSEIKQTPILVRGSRTHEAPGTPRGKIKRVVASSEAPICIGKL